MNFKVVKKGGREKNYEKGQRKIHCQNVAEKPFVVQNISKPSPEITDESEFPSLNELSGKVSSNSQSTGRVLKYSDKLKLHSNQTTVSNYFHFKYDPVQTESQERSNQTTSSPQLKNRWLHDTNKTKFDERLSFQTNKQNEPDKSDSVNRKVANVNSSQNIHKVQSNYPLRDSHFTKYNDDKNQSPRQKHVANISNSKLHTSVETTAKNSHANLPSKSNYQAQSKNEIKLIIGKSPIKEHDSVCDNLATKKKKKRKSKVKRQVALQTGKITVLTPEVHSRILNKTSILTPQNLRRILTDINDEDEYPELGRSLIPTSQKENYLKKESNSSDPVLEDCIVTKNIGKSIDVSAEKQLLTTKNVDKESAPLSDDKSLIEKKGKDIKAVHPNDPITVSFFDVLVNKSCKAKVKDFKAEVDLPASIGLAKMKVIKNSCHPHNLLDSSSPAVKRGKEREKPKPKKPSHLKKIILLDRKVRREQLLQLKSNNLEDESEMGHESEQDINKSENDEIDPEERNFLLEDPYENSSTNMHVFQQEIPEENSHLVPCNNNNDLVLHDDIVDLKVMNILPKNETYDSEETSVTLTSIMTSTKDTKMDHFTQEVVDSSDEVLMSEKSESSQSEITTDSTLASEKNLNLSESPDMLLSGLINSVKLLDSSDKEKAVKILLHTRNFREYCNHLISKDIDDVVYALLDDLARFQDRLHQKDPVKARMKRRMIYGVKEVKKHIKLKKLKCIIVAADIENIETHGGLNDLLNDIKSSAADHLIPCTFALSRKALGKVCRKPVPVSCVGVFNYEGSEINFRKMVELQTQSKIDYIEISSKLSQSITEEQITSLLKAKREAPETLRAVRTNILGDFFLENKTEAVEPDKNVVTIEKGSDSSDTEA